MAILRYILRRLLLILPVLAGVTFITFATTRLIPGNPVDRIVDAMVDDETRQEIIHEYGFDQPVYLQFIRYLGDISNGKFGRSFSTGRDVFDDLKDRAAATIELTLYSMTIAIVSGIILGTFAAIKRNSLIDHIIRVVSVIGVSAPSFWLGLILILIFFVELKLVGPPIGRIAPTISPPTQITGLYTFDALITGNWNALKGSLSTLILPCITLGFAGMAPIARMMRSEMIEVLNSDYIRAAMALGVPYSLMIRRLALKNALLPVVTMIGLVFGYQLGGVVLVETVFSWPGLGFYAFQAATGSDYYAVQGFVLYATTVYIGIFLVLDLIYKILDPRIEF